MRTARAALALLLACAVPVRAETTSDPLWYLLSVYVLTPDERARDASGEETDATGLAVLQADLLLLAEGFEAFRDEAQVEEALVRLEPRMSPELRPFFKTRASSLDAVYRTLAVVDFTWSLRFPDPPCAPAEKRAELLSAQDGLFADSKGEASPWLVALLGEKARGKSAARALDLASAKLRLSTADYEKRRALARKLTMALASEKAEGAARAGLYCRRAAVYEELAAHHRADSAAPLLAARSSASAPPEPSVFVVVSRDRRAAATLVKTRDGAALLTDAAGVAGVEEALLFAYAGAQKPVESRTKVLRRDAGLGLALLGYEGPERPAFTLADSVVEKDVLVTAWGHTQVSGLWTKTSGLVTKPGEAAFQTDAAVSVEFVGGPVLDESGRLAGLLVSRPANTEEGRWPLAVPAPVIARWLEDPSDEPSPTPAAEVIEDGGTAAVLSRARPHGLTETALPPMVIPGLPPPPPTPRGVCVSGCDIPSAPSPSRSYSRAPAPSRSTGYSGSGGAEMGQALGEALAPLVQALVFEGIPALFRGIGKLFKGKGGTSRSQSAPIVKSQAAKAQEHPKEPPPPPPPPRCELTKLSAPEKVGADEFEVAVRFTCDDGGRPRPAPRGGHSVTFTAAWDDKKPVRTVTVATNADGEARLRLRVANQKTAVAAVHTEAEGQFDDLDRYAAEEMETVEPDEAAQVAPALIQASAVETVKQAASVPGAAAAATALAGAVIVPGEGAVLVVSAKVTLGIVGTGALVMAASGVVFKIGWEIGSVAERKLSQVQRGLKSDEKNDCELARPWQLERVGIGSRKHQTTAHKFKDFWGATPNKFYDICACKDGSVVIKKNAQCGMPGPSITTDKRWK